MNVSIMCKVEDKNLDKMAREVFNEVTFDQNLKKGKKLSRMDPEGESTEKNATANSGGCTGLGLGGDMICRAFRPF